jgi:hypothetical protein
MPITSANVALNAPKTRRPLPTLHSSTQEFRHEQAANNRGRD